MTGRKELIKIVYEDNKETKVLVGYLIDETEFIYKVQAKRDGAIIDIGKRSLIKKIILEAASND